jgi:hypothetical protein
MYRIIPTAQGTDAAQSQFQDKKDEVEVEYSGIDQSVLALQVTKPLRLIPS